MVIDNSRFKVQGLEPPRQKFFEFLPPLRGRGMMEAVMTKYKSADQP